MNPTRHATTNGSTRAEDDASSGAAGRPLAHAIALRLLTAKGADAAGLKAYVARAGLAEAMVDVLEELTRRVRGLRVEFEDLATANRSALPPAPASPAATPPAAEPVAAPPPISTGRAIAPGW